MYIYIYIGIQSILLRQSRADLDVSRNLQSNLETVSGHSEI
jgi:hypothetical protein